MGTPASFATCALLAVSVLVALTAAHKNDAAVARQSVEQEQHISLRSKPLPGQNWIQGGFSSGRVLATLLGVAASFALIFLTAKCFRRMSSGRFSAGAAGGRILAEGGAAQCIEGAAEEGWPRTHSQVALLDLSEEDRETLGPDERQRVDDARETLSKALKDLEESAELVKGMEENKEKDENLERRLEEEKRRLQGLQVTVHSMERHNSQVLAALFHRERAYSRGKRLSLGAAAALAAADRVLNPDKIPSCTLSLKDRWSLVSLAARIHETATDGLRKHQLLKNDDSRKHLESVQEECELTEVEVRTAGVLEAAETLKKAAARIRAALASPLISTPADGSRQRASRMFFFDLEAQSRRSRHHSITDVPAQSPFRGMSRSVSVTNLPLEASGAPGAARSPPGESPSGVLGTLFLEAGSGYSRTDRIGSSSSSDAREEEELEMIFSSSQDDALQAPERSRSVPLPQLEEDILHPGASELPLLQGAPPSTPASLFGRSSISAPPTPRLRPRTKSLGSSDISPQPSEQRVELISPSSSVRQYASLFDRLAASYPVPAPSTASPAPGSSSSSSFTTQTLRKPSLRPKVTYIGSSRIVRGFTQALGQSATPCYSSPASRDDAEASVKELVSLIGSFERPTKGGSVPAALQEQPASEAASTSTVGSTSQGATSKGEDESPAKKGAVHKLLSLLGAPGGEEKGVSATPQASMEDSPSQLASTSGQGAMSLSDSSDSSEGSPPPSAEGDMHPSSPPVPPKPPRIVLLGQRAGQHEQKISSIRAVLTELLQELGEGGLPLADDPIFGGLKGCKEAIGHANEVALQIFKITSTTQTEATERAREAADKLKEEIKLAKAQVEAVVKQVSKMWLHALKHGSREDVSIADAKSVHAELVKLAGFLALERLRKAIQART